MRLIRLFACCLCFSLLFTACSLALPGAAGPAVLSTTEPPPEIAAPTDPPTATVPVTETPVPSPTPLRPEDLLWVANPADGNLRLIEPVTGSVAVIIPTGMQPSHVVVGEGSAWALDRVSNRVLRISLADYSLTAVIPIPQGVTDSLAVGEGYAWVGITERPLTNILLPYEEYHPAGGVLRIDPATNHITGYAATGPVADMAAAQGGLWVLARGEVDTPMQKVDPLTLTAQPVRLGGTADWLLDDSLAVTEDSLWLFSQAYGKLYRASHTGRLYAEISLGQHRPVGQARLLETQGALWLASPWGSLVRVDSGSNRVVSEIDLGVPLSDLGVSGGMLWAVSAQDGLAFRFDPAAGQVTGRVELGAKLTPTPIVTATPILRAYLPCEIGPYSRLVVGDRAHTLKEPPLPQRLHKEAAKETERTGWIQPGETVLILEGPVCAEDWVWWKVRTLTGGYTGWATEGDEDDYWLIPDK
jgi:hypothetical protein